MQPKARKVTVKAAGNNFGSIHDSGQYPIRGKLLAMATGLLSGEKPTRKRIQ